MPYCPLTIKERIRQTLLLNLPDDQELVLGVLEDDTVAENAVAVAGGPYPYRALGRPRDLDGLPRSGNLLGRSFACARVAAWATTKPLDPPGRSRYKDRLTGD